jgi:CheY-like chemotaxis protein
MTEETRRNVLRYGIAIDLVILATAIGLLAMRPTAPLLVSAFAVAVSLSVWRGGWPGGLTALLLSIAAIAVAFPYVLTANHWAILAGASLIGGTFVGLLTRKPKPEDDDVAAVPEMLAEVVPFAEPQKELDRERKLEEQLESERKAAEEELRRQLAEERDGLRAEAERERIAKETPATAPSTPSTKSLFDTIAGWFRRGEHAQAEHGKTKRGRAHAHGKRGQKGAAKPAPQPVSSKPRLLFIERRRAIADATASKLKNRGVESVVVERWVDAVDELFRFQPHALLLDMEHPEFASMHRHILEKSARLPILLTGRRGSVPPAVTHAAFVARPYETDDLLRLAGQAMERPEELLAAHAIERAPLPRLIALADEPPPIESANDRYDVTCFSCDAAFDAIDADWCSCLAKERTLICTNCLTCFCKASPAYQETFWKNAPPQMFDRKSAEKQESVLSGNAHRADVRRPLVMAAGNDAKILATVQRVCANLDYGFAWAMNGEDALELARGYRPDLILTGTFLDGIDGREMCRILKEEDAFANTRMVVMSGLYVDTKYRAETLKRFPLDDVMAMPASVTDLINVLQKHLEGVTGVPMPEDLHALHRRGLAMNDESNAASAIELEIIAEPRTLNARGNALPSDVKRPLILLVDDDENVRLLVRSVVTSMGYGFVAGDAGLASEYAPDLILVDALASTIGMGPNTVLMTGLYADRKPGEGAFVPKPLAAEDLIRLCKKRLSGESPAAR